MIHLELRFVLGKDKERELEEHKNKVLKIEAKQ